MSSGWEQHAKTSIHEHDHVYGKVMFDLGLIKKDEPALLDDLLGLFSQNLKRPNLLTYLEADVGTIPNGTSLKPLYRTED